MTHKITVSHSGNVSEYQAPDGVQLYELLRDQGYVINSQCGGNGTCGKCVVKVTTAEESSYKLACLTKITAEIEVSLDDRPETLQIATRGKRRSVLADPVVKKHFLNLPKPSLNDQRADYMRLEDSLRQAGFTGDFCLSPEVIRSLPVILPQSDYMATVVSVCGKTVAIEPGNTVHTNFGVAFDIGTTTVVGYLMNLSDGAEIASAATANPQRTFGADVITRINHTLSSDKAGTDMHKSIIQGINSIISQLTHKAKIGKNDIYAAVFAGNTTMLHFLLNLPAKGIALAPFTPVTTDMHILPAAEAGIAINPFGSAIVLPSVSAYIGGDTIAAVISSGMYLDEKISLLVDIGTNGEIVLGCKDWMYSCSAAAGPAFEGALIRNGASSINGAIDKVSLSPEVSFTTIGKASPVGICGSGLVDAIGEMVSTGVVDETGRFNEASSLPEYLASRIIELDGRKAFLLANIKGSHTHNEIAVTQKDVRELQNAKAAIAAGIKILIADSGVHYDDIKDVYLAGGFGSYIDIDNALVIGLLPRELAGKIEAIGNAAGLGALECLLSEPLLTDACNLRKQIKYIELSSSKAFTDEYIDNMTF